MFAAAILLSVAGLLIGPVLVAWTRGTRTALAALDGAILGIVPALVLLRLLPHLIEETGASAAVACAAGYLVFSAIEARTHGRAKNIGLAVVLPTLAIHGFLDGAGLALAFEGGNVLGAGGPAVGVALVVHKVPEGLFVASALLPTLGARRTSLRLVALAFATVFGALTGSELLAHTPDRLLHVVVALGLGVMLRMAIHRHEAKPQTARERLSSGIAFAVCLAGLLAVPDPQRLLTRSQLGELSALQALAPLLLETAPWLVVALLLGEGLARRTKPSDGSGGKSSMWLPVLALSLPLLGPLLTLVRAVLEPLCSAQQLSVEPSAPWRSRAISLLARAAPRASLVLPSYVVGVGLAIALEASAPRGLLGDVGWLAIPAAVLLAVIVRIGAAGATVLVAVLIHKGLPLSAAVVFTGVAAYVFTLHPTKYSVRAGAWASFAVVVAVLAVLILGPATPPLHGLAAHRHSWIEWVSAIALATWTLAQLVSAGPRAWFSALGAPAPSSHSD